MDISLNEDQVMLRETAISFAREVIPAARIRALETDERGFDQDTWKKIAQMGWAGAVLPERYGGSEAGLLDMALIIEALAIGAIPSPLFSTVIEAGLLLLEGGSEAQRSAWLPRIAEGDAILSTAIMESSGGLRPTDIRLGIAPVGNGFSINGTKLFVRDAAVAEVVVVAGRSGDKLEEITLLMVPFDSPGLKRERMIVAGGELLWQITFNNVGVDADAVIGEVNGAWPHIARLHQRGAAFKSAELVGIGQAALDLTVDYAKTRQQFGGPIGRFQAVHHHVADMYRDLEVSRLLAWQAAAALGEGMDSRREVSMAKAKISEVIPAVTRMAHQIHGAIGYYRDYPLELYYHRAIAAQASYGDAAYHRRVLSNLLFENPDAFRGDDRHDLPVHYF